MSTSIDPCSIKNCPTSTILALTDFLNVIHGKWKIPIIGALTFGKKRFKDLEQALEKITPRMLSKELKELELNNIVTRKVYNTHPIKIEYELTPSGKALEPILKSMVDWGMKHREVSIMEYLEDLKNTNQL